VLDRLKPTYDVRAARMDDAEAVVALCNAWTMEMQGIRSHAVERRRIDWQRSGFNLETDSLVVHDATGVLAAYASVKDADEPHVRIDTAYYVRPDHEDRELEVEMLLWMERRAKQSLHRAPAEARVVLTHNAMVQDVGRREILTRQGYELVRHFLRLRIEMDAPPAVPELPQGIAIRSLNRETDLPLVSMTANEAFRGHWGHVERDFDEDVKRYERWLDDDPDLDPSVWYLACEGDEVVGVLLGMTQWEGIENCAYIFTLGVRNAWRGRGIGRALLAHSFGAFYDRRRSVVELDVDTGNLTGACRLYESVGMREAWREDLYEKEIRPGVDLGTQA